MMGFEMAYIPVGNYYVASAQQVIAEEHRGTLTEIVSKDQVFAQATIGTKPNQAKQSKAPVVAKFPFDSYIPFNAEKLNDNLLQLKGKKVSITGFASLEGTKKYNKSLSQKRAEYIGNMAKTLGIKAVEIKSVGESQCYAHNSKEFPNCRKVEIYTLLDNGDDNP